MYSEFDADQLMSVINAISDIDRVRLNMNDISFENWNKEFEIDDQYSNFQKWFFGQIS